MARKSVGVMKEIICILLYLHIAAPAMAEDLSAACQVATQAPRADEVASALARDYKARWALSDCASGQGPFHGVHACIALAAVGRLAGQPVCETQALQRARAALTENCGYAGDEFSCVNQARVECQLSQRENAIAALQRTCSHNPASRGCAYLPHVDCTTLRFYDQQLVPVLLPGDPLQPAPEAKKPPAESKKYGVLRIESNPPGALVFKGGKKLTTRNEKGKDIGAITPVNILDIEISQTFEIRLELKGHQPAVFAVAPQHWIPVEGEDFYKLIKVVDLVPEEKPAKGIRPGRN